MTFQDISFTHFSYFITGVSIIYMLYRFAARRKQFLSFVDPLILDLKKYDSNLDDYGFQNSPISKSIEGQYERTFVNNKTESNADDYFSLDNINTVDFNLGFYSGYNNTLIGLGIFFTFLGLTIGVGYFGYNLSTADSNQQSQAITEGINVLMGGMGTAFASSVLGMLLSLSFSSLYKEKVNRIDAGLSHISNDLDSKFLKTSSDFALERDQKLLELIEGVMIKNESSANLRLSNTLDSAMLTYVDEKDERVGMASMTKELLIQSTRQSDSLHTFSNDLADAFYDALNKGDESNGSIVQILRDGFKALLDSEKDPINDLVENLLIELKKTFSKMSDDITNSIESVIKDIESKAGGQVIEQANEAAAELNKVTDHIAKLPGILEMVNSQTGETASFTKDMVSKVNDTIDKLQGVIELQSIAAEEIKEATSIYADKRSEMNTSLESIKLTSRSLEKSVVKLDGDFDKYTEHTTQLEDQRSQNLSSVSSLVETAAKMNSDLISNLEIIEVGIHQVFEKISEGLNGYHEQISQNTKVELGAYSESVIKITEGLHSIVDTLNASIEDLDDRLGKNR